MAATQLVQALQTIVTRNRNPYDPAVLSLTQIHAGSADNVIPDKAELRGTVRTFTEDTLDIIERRIGELAQRSEEHTSELQSLMRISYAVFCLKKKKTKTSQ